jgi:serine/threonine protein kinase/tetratricopeptide (TPR) repeat protein
VTSDRSQRIEQLYNSALELQEGQRAAYLKQACPGDDELRQEVESLLAQGTQSVGFLKTPALEVAAREMAAHQTRSLVGQLLGSYKIVSLLGVGGMGEVYRAHDIKLGRDVAIKVLPAAFVDDLERLARFQREARMLAALNHPNIATIHGLEQSGGLHYLVMELVEGETLAERISRGALPVGEALEVAEQIAEALEAAHERGVIHRDLKPANINLTPEGRVKVLDFGLAKAFAGEGGDLSNAPTLTALGTEEGRILGTPAYMSPEQARGKPVDKRTDIWAFGCVLCELLTAQRPFRGETPTDTVAAILTQEPDWQALPTGVPPRIRELLQRCLQKEPQRRLRDFGDARIEIDAALAAQSASPVSAIAGSSGGLWSAFQSWRHSRWFWGGVISVALVVAGAGFRLLSEARRRLPSVVSIRSIAVLPLSNVSANSDEQYFADGMTDELVSEISQVHALRVISQTSGAQYRDTKKPIPQIAKELGVDGLIEGSVLRVNDRARVTVQLVHGSTDSHVWSKTYDRASKDVIGLQDEIASDIARELQVSLLQQEEKHLARPHEASPEAYDAYLQGRFHLQKFTERENNRAIDYFQQAIAKDAAYAPAYAGLADAYTAMRSVYLAPHEVMPKAKAAALKALELDETLPEAHLSLGGVYLFYEFDWKSAEREIQRAIAIRPNYAEAHDYYAMFLVANRRFPAAGEEILRARELDPVSALIAGDASWVFYLSRDYDRAAQQGEQAIDLDPTSWVGYTWLGLAYQKKGQFTKAIDMLEKARQLDDNVTTLEMLAGAYAAAGQTAKAKTVTASMVHRSSQRYVCPYEIATTYIGLRDKESAFEWLRKSLDERADCSVWALADPKLDSLRSDPRFADLLRRMNLQP